MGQEGSGVGIEEYGQIVRDLPPSGIRLTVVVYPWPDQIEHRQRQCLQSVFWKSFAFERNIAFLDLFPLFINNADPEVVIDNYFIPGDPHWNRKGHRLVADALFQYLTSHLSAKPPESEQRTFSWSK